MHGLDILPVLFAQEHIIEGIKKGDPAAWVAVGGVVVLVLGALVWGMRNERRR